jgi:hypothetical protein
LGHLRKEKIVQKAPFMLLVAAVCVFSLLATAVGQAAVMRLSQTVQLSGTLPATWKGTKCPPGVPVMIRGSLTPCYLVIARGTLPGLGKVTHRRIVVVLDPEAKCANIKFSMALTVGTKGTISGEAATKHCFAKDGTAVVPFKITGGTGAFNGATGSGTITLSEPHVTGYGHGVETETWKGKLTVST